MRISAHLTLVPVLLLMTALQGCSGSSADDPAKSSPGHSSAAGDFKPVHAGVLTVVTNLPGPGFFDGDTPESIHGGYEYGMAQEIAKRLGLPRVAIVNSSFDAIVAGQVKNFDVALSTINITPERQRVVDFSVPYLSSDQGILVRKGTNVNAGNAKTLPWGVQSSSTSEAYLSHTLKPAREPKIYQDQPSMFAALQSKQIDAVLLDTVAVLAEAKQAGGSLQVVGQFKTGGVYGAVFPKGDRYEGAINRIITTLKTDGTLSRLSARYLVPQFGQDPDKVPYLTP